MNKRIRVKLSKDGEWVFAQLLQITEGWVEVDTGTTLIWVMRERCHPDDLRELARKREKTKTKKFSAIKIDEDELPQQGKS